MVCISCYLIPLCVPLITAISAYFFAFFSPLLKTLQLQKLFGFVSPASSEESSSNMVCSLDGTCSLSPSSKMGVVNEDRQKKEDVKSK